MYSSLFVDGLNALASELEANVIHLLTHGKKISQKVETLTTQLLNFKLEIYRSISALFKNSIQSPKQPKRPLHNQILSQLSNEVVAINEKLVRYRLHQILKSKISKKKRQSMIGSSQSFKQNEELSNLEMSVILIQKDLGIQNESDQISKMSASALVNRTTLFNLEKSPICEGKFQDYSVISENGSIPAELDSISIESNLDDSKYKENMQQNGKDQQTQLTKPSQPMLKKILGPKKKKIIYSKTESGQGLLGNLLQQTYNQCLKKQ